MKWAFPRPGRPALLTIQGVKWTEMLHADNEEMCRVSGVKLGSSETRLLASARLSGAWAFAPIPTERLGRKFS